MNENARRQQEESRRLNAPSAQSPSPSYQRGAHLAPPGRPAAPATDVSARIAPGDFTNEGSSLKGEFDFYAARSTIHRSGSTVRMWEMLDLALLRFWLLLTQACCTLAHMAHMAHMAHIGMADWRALFGKRGLELCSHKLLCSQVDAGLLSLWQARSFWEEHLVSRVRKAEAGIGVSAI